MTFKEYIQLNESVTLVVSGADYAEPMRTLNDLGFYLEKKILPIFRSKLPPEEEKSLRFMQTIMPDGDEWDHDTGTLNFYVGDLSPENIEKITKAIVYFLGEVGAKVGKIRADDWEDYHNKQLRNISAWGDDDPAEEGWEGDFQPKTAKQKSDEYEARFRTPDYNPRKIRVVRIPVISREPIQKDQPPDLNITSYSADLLFRELLGYPVDYMDDQLSVADILIKLSQLGDFHIQNAVQPTTRDKNWISQGYDEERIRGLVSRLEQICLWARQHGYEYLQFVG